ncbi:hypothetical protein EV144_101126 [Flavobacterium sp. 270]|nr:hypothetical protein EV144_101126 [Flavobacterium sp. 270]
MLTLVKQKKLYKMKITSILTGILILLISCNSKTTEKENSKIISKETIKEKELVKDAGQKTDAVIEIFEDSTKIAQKGSYKIKIIQETIDTTTNVKFELFEKLKNNWKKVQSYALHKDASIPLLTEIEDFNNDGYNDFTIHYSTAARGANDIRKLFIFAKKENKFIEIKNSDYYSNLSFNKKLNCINSLEVYRGTTTGFFRIKKDSLVEFARVDFIDDTVHSYLIKNGKEIKLESKLYDGDNDEMISFINYKPIEEGYNK